MVDRNTAWAVGNDRAEGGSSGFVYRLSWTGERWTATQDARFDAPLLAIDAVDAANVWAVGERGLIVRREGNAWRTVPSPALNASLVTLQMLGNGGEGLAHGQYPRELFLLLDRSFCEPSK